MRKSIVTTATAVVATTALAVGASAAHGSKPRVATPRGAVDPTHFSHPRANPYYPIEPGLVTRLRGRDGAEEFRERVTVTWSTKMIQGVRTRVVYDVLHRRDGSLAEKTWDWYAADNVGNVWYFGEDTATYNRKGHLESRDGSWMAGRDGAVPGIIMPANPKPTDAYRQEYWRGHAEDQAWITDRGERLRVPAGTFQQVVRSYEWSRLEPGVVSVKLYVPGIGIAKERDVAGGSEVFRLVGVKR